MKPQVPLDDQTKAPQEPRDDDKLTELEREELIAQLEQIESDLHLASKKKHQ